MNTMMRRSVIGAIAGALSSAALVAPGEHLFLGVALGVGIGAAYSATLHPTRICAAFHFGIWPEASGSAMMLMRVQSGTPPKCGNFSLCLSAGSFMALA